MPHEHIGINGNQHFGRNESYRRKCEPVRRGGVFLLFARWRRCISCVQQWPLCPLSLWWHWQVCFWSYTGISIGWAGRSVLDDYQRRFGQSQGHPVKSILSMMCHFAPIPGDLARFSSQLPGCRHSLPGWSAAELRESRTTA